MTGLRSMMLSMSVAAMLSACDRREVTGPPTVRLGLDQCAACGMIINEDRCSSALLIEREGRCEHAMFDDLGCMLDYEHENGGTMRVRDRYAHDHATKAWVAADSAVYLYSQPHTVATPMGSGIIAFADQASADKAKAEFGGDILDYARLVPARRASVDARSNKGRSTP